jgi:hypothetical protein
MALQAMLTLLEVQDTTSCDSRLWPLSNLVSAPRVVC